MFANRSKAWFSLDDFDAAKQDALEAIRLDPCYFKAHARLGNACMELCEYFEAVSAFSETLRLEPEACHRETRPLLDRAKAAYRTEQEAKAPPRPGVPAPPRHLAVLVGHGRDHSSDPTRFIRDVGSLQLTLERCNIRVLHALSGPKPRELMHAIDALVAQARPEDVTLFYTTGHGGRKGSELMLHYGDGSQVKSAEISPRLSRLQHSYGNILVMATY